MLPDNSEGYGDSSLGQSPREEFCGHVGAGERGAALDSVNHHVVENAGRKLPDEERKSIQAGTAGHEGIKALVDIFDNVPQYM
jgi:hypothetical protein